MENTVKKNWQSHCSLGKITLVEEGGYITHLQRSDTVSLTGAVEEETPLLRRAIYQLDEYFAGTRQCFDLPLAPASTTFQQRVWATLSTIPYGTTCCYEQVAQHMGDPKWSRAVGNANHHNPILILIPCHRIVSKQGKLAGYAAGVQWKEQLLLLEKQFLRQYD